MKKAYLVHSTSTNPNNDWDRHDAVVAIYLDRKAAWDFAKSLTVKSNGLNPKPRNIEGWVHEMEVSE